MEEMENKGCLRDSLPLPKKRIVIAGTGSGCGKTTITAGLLQCLKNRGISAAAFKCGPDYIDPMFHEKVLGTKSENLDLFFSDQQTLRYLTAESAQGCEISVAEGVMGFYDGIGMTEEASTYAAAKAIEAPVILVINARGMASSLLAVLEGFLNHRPDSRIRGVIFNRLPAKLYDRLSDKVRGLGVEPLGYLPSDRRAEIESRHLGLVTAGEISDLQEKMQRVAEWMEETVDIDGILRIAAEAEFLTAQLPERIAAAQKRRKSRAEESMPRIALASDEAFCFTYRSNLMMLRRLGTELIPFSPLRDESLPPDIDGLILSGGYPELYADRLEKNEAMRSRIRAAATVRMPIIAECGGFMYLHSLLEGAEQVISDVGEDESRRPLYAMTGVIPGECRRGDYLKQFGYITLCAEKDGMLSPAGETLKAHEFHYWKSSAAGTDFIATKADGSRSWSCGYSTETMYAGFPHLFFCSGPEAAERFVNQCAEFRKKRQSKELDIAHRRKE